MKRSTDIIASFLGMVILIPLFLIIAILIYIKLGRPIFFKQIRPGKNGNPFTLIKFRTMSFAKNENGDLLPNKDRLTKFGSLLRSLSLDELPELYNVLKGEMSIVGPRPLLMEYIPLFDEFQKRRMEVKPGITGWTQVNGRNSLSWDEKFKLDVWYVDNQNFLLDLKILFLTLIKVIKREGISHEGDVAMPRFSGNEPN